MIYIYIHTYMGIPWVFSFDLVVIWYYLRGWDGDIYHLVVLAHNVRNSNKLFVLVYKPHEYSSYKDPEPWSNGSLEPEPWRSHWGYEDLVLI